MKTPKSGRKAAGRKAAKAASSAKAATRKSAQGGKPTKKTKKTKSKGGAKAKGTLPRAVKAKSGSDTEAPKAKPSSSGAVGRVPAAAPAERANKAATPATEPVRTRQAAKAARPVRQAEPAPLADRHDSQEPLPLRKSRLTPEELDEFRNMLLTKRAELTGVVNHLRDDALHRSRQESSGDLSSMPIHMADIGSDNWEQEFTLGLLANENELLREIDEALRRIEDGTYGVCLGTNTHIQKRRLRAKPWAKYCIEYAQQMERRRGR